METGRISSLLIPSSSNSLMLLSSSFFLSWSYPNIAIIANNKVDTTLEHNKVGFGAADEAGGDSHALAVIELAILQPGVQ